MREVDGVISSPSYSEAIKSSSAFQAVAYGKREERLEERGGRGKGVRKGPLCGSGGEKLGKHTHNLFPSLPFRAGVIGSAHRGERNGGGGALFCCDPSVKSHPHHVFPILFSRTGETDCHRRRFLFLCLFEIERGFLE